MVLVSQILLSMYVFFKTGIIIVYDQECASFIFIKFTTKLYVICITRSTSKYGSADKPVSSR